MLFDSLHIEIQEYITFSQFLNELPILLLNDTEKSNINMVSAIFIVQEFNSTVRLFWGKTYFDKFYLASSLSHLGNNLNLLHFVDCILCF
jgi:hypothetical protein